jgi:predicted site-specific integrase-resolvase
MRCAMQHTADLPLSRAAQRLGVSWGAAWRLLHVGELVGTQHENGRWYVTEASVSGVLAARQQSGAGGRMTHANHAG